MKRVFIIPVLLMTFGLVGMNQSGAMAWQDTKTEEKSEKDAGKKQEAKEEKKVEEDDAPTLDEQMQEVMQTLRSGEMEEGYGMLKKVYAQHPDDERIGFTMMQVLQQLGSQKSAEKNGAGNKYFIEGGKIARKYKGKKSEIPPMQQVVASCIYNEACAFALSDKKAEAMKSLDEAFSAGFDSFDHALQDGDFGDLLKTDEYKALVEKHRKAAAAKKAEALKKSISDFKSFDFDFSAEDVDGKKISKSDFKGKLLIVDVWGTWCPPCRREIPSFIKLKKNYGEKLDIVGLAKERVDTDEEAIEKVSDFMEDNDMNYRCALLSDEVAKQIPELRAFPTTLFIDGTGKVRFMVEGFRPYEELEDLAKQFMK